MKQLCTKQGLCVGLLSLANSKTGFSAGISCLFSSVSLNLSLSMGTNSLALLTNINLKEKKETEENKRHGKSKLPSSFERIASFLCLLFLLYVRGETAENSCLFSSVSLTPIAEYGHQQFRVENNPKILRRRPHNPLKKTPNLKSENPKLKNPSEQNRK